MRYDEVQKDWADRAVLEAAYAEMRADVAGAGPSHRVEERVLAELDAARPAVVGGSTGRMWSWVTASAVVCVVALIAGASVLHRGAARGAGGVPAQAASTPAEEPFTAMPYVVPPAPYERTTVVRTEVPVQTMVAAGFDVHGGDLGSSTPADVLYGEDGRILAIRLISQTDTFNSKRMD